MPVIGSDEFLRETLRLALRPLRFCLVLWTLPQRTQRLRKERKASYFCEITACCIEGGNWCISLCEKPAVTHIRSNSENV